jgi:hypothetical protein
MQSKAALFATVAAGADNGYAGQIARPIRRNADRLHDDLAAVKNLEAAFASDEFTEGERISGYANYRNAVVAELKGWTRQPPSIVTARAASPPSLRPF